MKNTIKYPFLLIALLAVGLLPSCLLETEPVGSIENQEAISSTDGLEGMVNGAYSQTWSGNGYGGLFQVYSELVGDNFEVFSEVNAGNYELYRRELVNPDAAEDMYQQGYRAVNTSNEIISAVLEGKVEDKNNYYEANKDRWLGEAFFIRAINYFALVRIFCPQYDEARSFIDDPAYGIPMPLSPTRGRTTYERSTIRAIYDQIISDLENAQNLLPEEYDESIHDRRYFRRATKDAAIAYLARVHFQKATTQSYDEALDWANQILSPITDAGSNYAFSNTYEIEGPQNQLWQAEDRTTNPYYYTGYQKSPETIFQICNWELNSSIGLLTGRFNINRVSEQQSQYGTSRSFSQTLGIPSSPDVRTSLFDGLEGSTFADKFYRGEIPQLFIQNNVPLIRYPELLLTRAEVNASRAQGDSSQAYQDALNDLNTVRYYRGANTVQISDVKGYANSVNISENCALLAYVRSELRVERIAEGERLFSFKRQYIADKNGVTTNCEAVPTFTNDAPGTRVNDVDLSEVCQEVRTTVCPIPLDERTGNPNMAQSACR